MVSRDFGFWLSRDPSAPNRREKSRDPEETKTTDK
jgi:hypothetical protein